MVSPRLLVLTLLPLFALRLPAQSEAVDEYIRREMKARNIPGLALAIIGDGRVLLKKCYGMANLETGTPVTSESVFELASLTKPFTAAAIMMLAEQGRLRLDESIQPHVFQAPDLWKDIRVEHLLSHTAGFPEQVIVGYGESPLMDVSTLQQLDFIINAPVLFPPGSNAQYADPGYFLLGVIIERISGRPYREFMHERIFAPLGMQSTRVLDQWRIVKNRVSPYMTRRGRLLRARRDWQVELPSYFGVLASLEDLIRWEIALGSDTLLDKTALERMWTPAKVAGGLDALVYGEQYGLGWKLGDVRGHRIAEHGGFSGTHMLRFLDDRLTVIVLTNLDAASNSRPEVLARGVAGFVHPDLQPPHMMDAQPDPDPVRSRALREFLADFAAGRDSAQWTPKCREALNSLLPRVRADLARTINTMEDFTFIACDDVATRRIERSGQPVGRICYYKARHGDQSRIHIFYMTAGNKVAHWRPYAF